MALIGIHDKETKGKTKIKDKKSQNFIGDAAVLANFREQIKQSESRLHDYPEAVIQMAVWI
jgi:hypothetical protein